MILVLSWSIVACAGLIGLVVLVAMAFMVWQELRWWSVAICTMVFSFVWALLYLKNAYHWGSA